MSATERVVGRGPGPIKGDIDEPFRRSMASLSDQLAARPVEPPPRFDADDRAPLDPVERAGRPEGRSAVWAVGFMLGAIAGACLIYSFIDTSFLGKSRPTAAPAPASTPATSVAAAPPPPAVAATPTSPPPPVQERWERQLPAPAGAPPLNLQPPAPAAEPGKLEPYEIMEVQTRLKALGVEPGMLLDGLPGRQTKAAIQRYEESRGQTPTGAVDRALLNRLRQETKAP